MEFRAVVGFPAPAAHGALTDVVEMIPVVALAFLLATHTTSLDVCLSPGCLADGAESTLKKLQALAPPSVCIKAGVCCSLCGNGPVVTSETEQNIVKHRKVKDQKVLDLLFSGNDLMPDALIQGFDLATEGNEAYEKGNHERALELFEEAIDVAFNVAMDLQKERDGVEPMGETTRTKFPVGLGWLIDARRNEASARLKLGDLDGAVLAASASCNLSRNTSPDSFDVLAKVYEAKGDTRGELEALKSLFALPGEETKLPVAVLNRRRALKFRVEKLKREV